MIRLRKAGHTYDEIAAQTGLSRTGVFDICKRHDNGGAKALRDASGGRQLGDKREGAEIHWGDETGLRSDDVRGRSFAPQGQTPVVRVNNMRHGLSIISTVTNRGQMRWKIFDGALNAAILIDFMKRLIRDAGRKVYLILDKLRVHHSKLAKAWLAQHQSEIAVFYLPSYSPELNPDEMANADLKQAVTKLAPARTKLQLIKSAAAHLRSVQRQPQRIMSYFEHHPVRYAA